VEKHRRIAEAPAMADVTAGFVAASHRIHDLYANRIVGF
jgi:hypothetical protein